MYFQNILAPLNVRIRYRNLTVKTPRAQQSRIKNVGTVSRRNQNNVLVRFKTVHLDQQLVQRLFALVVAAAQTGAAMTADSVDFVNKQQTGGIFLSLRKHVTNTRRTDADKHFDEIRTRNREKRYICLAGYRFGQQGLSGTRRTDQQNAFRNFAAQSLKLGRVFQKVNNLFQFLF